MENWNDLSSVSLTASSEWDSNYAVNNIKGSTTNPWHGRGMGSAWISFKFEKAVRISGFRYRNPSGWDGSSFKNFRFEHQTNNGWESFHEGQGPDLDCCAWQEIRLNTSPLADSFRLFMLDDWGYGWLAIQELQLRTVEDCV